MHHGLKLDQSGRPGDPEYSRLPALAAMAAAVAILYFAKEIFLPLAIAVLLTFMLAPIVSRLRRLGLSRIIAIVISVTAGFLVISLFAAILAFQVTEVGQNIARYQYNIIEKVRTLKEASTENSLIDRLNRFAERLGSEFSQQEDSAQDTVADRAPKTKPVLVEIFSPRNPVETLENIIGPLIGPLATAGLVLVVVIFMLHEREDLRDRFIRLVGYSDLHRTTIAIEEAGSRVGKYLLTQLLVNVTYGVPLGIGLWLLGIPNALLWGMLAIVLRFAPYIGPVIAAVMPLFLAFAIAPGWSLLLWTIALFLVIELISNNLIEPWLYGSRTGLSPLAIIISAIIWTWLWGPIGLVLSTPLTVCLVVLGRYVPQFRFLEILFGSEPVLGPEERLYQRLLAGDPSEATDNAVEYLEQKFLVEFYDRVAIPALLIAQTDRARGALTDLQLERTVQSAKLLVENLTQIAAEELDDDEDVALKTTSDEHVTTTLELPPGDGKTILCIGARGGLDDVTAAMLAQVLKVQGAVSNVVEHTQFQPSRLGKNEVEAATAIVLCVLDTNFAKRARFSVRRLKRLKPAARIGVALFALQSTSTDSEAERWRADLGADFVVINLASAVIECLSSAESG